MLDLNLKNRSSAPIGPSCAPWGPLYSQWKWAQVVPETFVSESVGLNNSA